jgi:hypothetical protein
MKNMKQKLQRWIPSALIGLALSTSVSFGLPVITVSTFDTSAPVDNNIWDWYGGSSHNFDAAVDHTGNGGGSLHISQPSAGGDDTIIVPETLTGGAWWWSQTFDLTLYTNVSCWFKWDTTSSMPISTFNTEGTGGFSIWVNDSTGFGDSGRHALPYAQIPNAASNGWVHLNFPLVNTIPNIGSIVAVEYMDWKPAPWSGTVKFWIDDVTFVPGTLDVVPPPIVSPLVKATQGLNVFASTSGNAGFDRQEGELMQTTGLGWIGHATTGNPVSYSFTIADFPTDPATYGCESYLFLSPNPVANDGAPDWNETNCVIAFIQLGADGAIMHLQYKVNEDHQQAMYTGVNETRVEAGITNHYYYSSPVGSQPGGPIIVPIGPNEHNITNESGNLGSVTNPTALGTWTIRFTSSTNVTLVAPGGNTTSYVIPAYKIGYLTEGASGLNVYLGMQANVLPALNKAVVYSHFSITGSGTPFNENFLTDTVLDTTNVWRTTVASGAPGVLIVPAGSAYWMSWTLPDGGFSSQASASVAAAPAGWTSPAGVKIPMNGIRSQLIAASDLPAGNDAFLRLIKRVFTKLQILLPGMTAAPNTGNGYTGTPTAQQADPDGSFPFSVIVNGVDDAWNVVNGPTDTIHLASTDVANFLVTDIPADLALSGGTVTFTVVFLANGSSTITASDLTDGSKTSATSPTVTY